MYAMPKQAAFGLVSLLASLPAKAGTKNRLNFYYSLIITKFAESVTLL